MIGVCTRCRSSLIFKSLLLFQISILGSWRLFARHLVFYFDSPRMITCASAVEVSSVYTLWKHMRSPDILHRLCLPSYLTHAPPPLFSSYQTFLLHSLPCLGISEPEIPSRPSDFALSRFSWSRFMIRVAWSNTLSSSFASEKMSMASKWRHNEYQNSILQTKW
jgi:hypothetical protein